MESRQKWKRERTEERRGVFSSKSIPSNIFLSLLLFLQKKERMPVHRETRERERESEKAITLLSSTDETWFFYFQGDFPSPPPLSPQWQLWFNAGRRKDGNPTPPIFSESRSALFFLRLCRVYYYVQRYSRDQCLLCFDAGPKNFLWKWHHVPACKQ